MALYVLAHGIGPLIFSPLSELVWCFRNILSELMLSRIPAIGRNPIYIATFMIFVILQIPTALDNNFAGLLVLRFLAGIFGLPCLATGAATFQDMYPIIKIPYLIAL